MSRVATLAREMPQRLPLVLDLPRAMTVIGCALALICAGKPLPF